jgi:hypothetical protein
VAVNARMNDMKSRYGVAFRNVLLSTCLLTGLSACAPRAQIQASNSRDYGEFEAGASTLTCGVTCFDAWRSSQPELFVLYQAGEWQRLWFRVLQIGYRQDLGYFYLGRAAEGLGQRSAALAYYRAAVDLASGSDPSAKCIVSTTACDGLNLLTEALQRIQIVRTPRGSAVQARRAARSPGPTRPDTSSSWVDPPPIAP